MARVNPTASTSAANRRSDMVPTASINPRTMLLNRIPWFTMAKKANPPRTGVPPPSHFQAIARPRGVVARGFRGAGRAAFACGEGGD